MPVHDPFYVWIARQRDRDPGDVIKEVADAWPGGVFAQWTHREDYLDALLRAVPEDRREALHGAFATAWQTWRRYMIDPCPLEPEGEASPGGPASALSEIDIWGHDPPCNIPSRKA